VDAERGKEKSSDCVRSIASAIAAAVIESKVASDDSNLECFSTKEEEERDEDDDEDDDDDDKDDDDDEEEEEERADRVEGSSIATVSMRNG
jgi:hypothetical protein